MKKVDSNNGVWVNDDPTTLTNGTPIDADFMNNIQDEISNVITDNGETLDGTNHSQLSQTLDKTFAKLNSPTLTGIPLTSNPDGTINNQIATVDYVNQKALQATVGFTPTQQGGGTDQGANKVYIGGDSTDATQVRVQVDQADLGKIVFQAEDNNTYGVSKIGYDHVKGELAYYDTGNKAWHYSYTTDYIDGKAYISSLPTGDNVKVTDIIWNTSSNLPAYYYGVDNQVSYSATTEWSQKQFLQLSDENIQSVTGPVAFSVATTVPDVSAFTGADALNARTADKRYVRNNAGTNGGVVAIDLDGDGSGDLAYQKADGSWGACQAQGSYVKSVPATGGTNVRIVDAQEDAAGNLIATKSDGTTTSYAPGSYGTFTGGYWIQTGNIRQIWWGQKIHNGDTVPFPLAFIAPPKVYTQQTLYEDQAPYWEMGYSCLPDEKVTATNFVISTLVLYSTSGGNVAAPGGGVIVNFHAVGVVS